MTDNGTMGCRLLVVEDEAVIALDLKETLEKLGCEIVGPINSIATAMKLAKSERLDGALLDVNIQGNKISSVAKLLQERGIPVLLVSGYDFSALPEFLREMPRLSKPFTDGDFEDRVRKLCLQRTSQAGATSV
jgi:two-component SAPR family response regulator